MPRLPVHSETLLDLLRRQQTHGEAGVRMCFHQELLAPLSLRDNPYHYCAVAGRPELAAYLYKNGIPCVSDMTVATFSAGGVEGESVWKKGLTLTPCEAALMAGNTVTAEVLKNIERGIPLEWQRSMHSKFPASFKEEVEELVEALSQAAWFIGMPGPARLTVMDRTVTDMAREAVWGMLDPGFWEVLGGEGEVEHELLGPGVESSTIETLIKHWGKQPAKGQDRRLQAPQYQFRVAAGNDEVRRRFRWLRPRALLGQVAKVAMILAVRRFITSRIAPGNRPPAPSAMSALLVLPSLLMI